VVPRRRRDIANASRFNTFFTHLDNYKDTTFLYLTSGGIGATKEGLKKKSTQPRFEEDSDGEGYASDN
jgi:tRNA pseudouridine38-40 synthase